MDMTHRHKCVIIFAERCLRMTRVRLSVDVDSELRRRVKVAAAARDQSVKEWIEEAIREALRREARRTMEYAPDESAVEEDQGWL